MDTGHATPCLLFPVSSNVYIFNEYHRSQFRYAVHTDVVCCLVYSQCKEPEIISLFIFLEMAIDLKICLTQKLWISF